MKKSTAKITCSNKADKKDVVLFVIACVLLLGSLFFLCSPTDSNSTYAPEEPQLPNSKVAGVALATVATFLGIILIFAPVFSCWACGLTVSAVLAIRKRERPRWLRISSFVLMSIYLILILGTILVLFIF